MDASTETMIVKLFTEQNKSVDEIASFFNEKKNPVKAVLRKNGVVFTNRSSKSRTKLKYALILRLRDEGYKVNDLAAVFGHTPGTIYQICYTHYLDDKGELREVERTKESVKITGSALRSSR